MYYQQNKANPTCIDDSLTFTGRVVRDILDMIHFNILFPNLCFCCVKEYSYEYETKKNIYIYIYILLY